MAVACWSAKGGSGTTVIAAALALLRARSSPGGAVLVDLGGDAPHALGLPPPAGPGVRDWLAAPDAEPEALDRLLIDAGGGLRVLPVGNGSGSSDRLVAALLARDDVVVDCGPPSCGLGMAVAAAMPVSLLVLRPCFLGLRRALDSLVRPTGVVVVDEKGHGLTGHDITAAVTVPVVARVPVDPLVARAVDGGTLATRVPRSLARALRGLR
ncbi:MAG TPA: hypothetical protein VM938_09750 [Acidimicrobiales bacterium]|nr:hypothetical protein [Acidimicrobiales bacterium]